MNAATSGKWVACLLVFCVNTGYGNEPVQELAEKTAANIGALKAQIARLSDESRKLAERRARIVANLHGQNTWARTKYDFDIALVKRAGEAQHLESIQWTKDWVAEAEKSLAMADSVVQSRRAAILATQEPLDTKSSELQAISESLATLAKNDDAKHKAEFLGQFAKEVRDNVKDALTKGDEAAKNASALLDKLGLPPPKASK